MVTFTQDYWAPGLDKNASRAPDAVSPHLTVPAPAQLKSSSSTSLNVFSCNFMEDSSDSWNSTQLASNIPLPVTPIPVTPTSTEIADKADSKLSYKTSRASTPISPPPEGGILADIKAIWSDILSSSKSSKKAESPYPEPKPHGSACPSPSLTKKYGVCERKLVGKGATAVVRVAHKLDHNQNETLYAIKEFRKRRKDESPKEYIKKLTGEFCISSSLQHTNIVATVDLVMDDNSNWCEVMEFCPGGDLYNVIKNGQLTTKEINCCFKQLIHGLAYLHSMGVAHRDIKPENLLVDEHCHIKITDFGVSDVFRSVWEKKCHRSRGLCGSEPYIAPEEFIQDDYDARLVDVWAAGIVYYSMSYRTVPFRIASMDDTNYRHFIERRNQDRYEPFNKYDPGCKNLMFKILDPNPMERITIDEILQDPWFQSIEVCQDGVASHGFHNHYDMDYFHKKMNASKPSTPRSKSKTNSPQ
jgi:tRNA A-37 threonylcarbamoyl transferase component Bud32